MPEKKQDKLISRPPVVVVMGHVDHGKSSLLEAIKDFNITAKESGGITQHVGAYEAEHNGKKITFIDTPGHEAFSAIRSRGAKLADVAILVVAADEGVKAQTKEAILHARKAEIPIIVAINKIDKSEADSQKVKRELVKEEIVVESMGGKIPSVEVSAKTKKGIPELLEMILLIAEMENLRVSTSKIGQGVIVESYLNSSRGPVATLILQEGILKKGDIVGTFSTVGKIKILENFQGKPVNEVLPSMPAIVLGFENVPGVGETFKVFKSAEEADQHLKRMNRIEPEVLVVDGDKKVLNIVLKTDVLGSLEAIEEIIKELPKDQVIPRIIKGDVGEIGESDVKLAKGAKAKILAFRIKTNPIAKNLASREKVTIINFEIIYELVQSVRQLMEKMLSPEIVRTGSGRIKILEFFKAEKGRQIVGGRVMEGLIKRGVSVEVFRGEEKIGKGKIIGLQKNKKDADEAAKGSECGMLFEGDAKIEKGDILEAYTEERKKGEL